MDYEHEEESKGYTSQLKGETAARKLRVPHTEAGLGVFAQYEIRYESRFKCIFEELEYMIDQTIQNSHDLHKMIANLENCRSMIAVQLAAFPRVP